MKSGPKVASRDLWHKSCWIELHVGAIDQSERRFSRKMTANIRNGGHRGRMRLGDRGDMRRDHDAGVPPQRMIPRQRLRIDDIKKRSGQMAAVERVDQSRRVKLTSAPRMNERSSSRQHRKKIAVEDAFGLGVERQ